ncbi:MAG: lysylphosphatidylglycerol synthase transmembrane domain-containing protein [Acidimicrobiia bacterium]
MGAVSSRTATDPAAAGFRPRWGRIALLAITGICLYVFAPSLAEVFEAWDRLGEVHPLAVIAVVACEAASFLCVWMLQRISIGTTQWFSVAMSQLAGNAFNRVTPGGGATGTALQARMLGDAGIPTTRAATALTVQSLLITAAVAAMPLLSLPAIIIAGIDVPGDLADGAWFGAGLFLVMLVLGALLLGSRQFACRLGSTIEKVANAFPRETPLKGLGERILRERDEIRRTMGERWPAALGAAVGRWAFEYFALLVTLYAIGATPDPWLVLLAFVFASALGMIPFTPGGLGFVEAGLTGALALAGVSAEEAVLGTLVFRLVSFWLPLPVGAVAGYLFRRRYPSKRSAKARAAPA